MRKKIIWLGALSLILLLFSACRKTEKNGDTYTLAKDGQTIIIGLDDTFVPMGFREKDGSLSGFDIDLATAVFKKLDVPIRFQAIDWSMKETELSNQTIDLIWNGYSKTPDREKTVAFSIPYLANRQVLLTKKTSGVKKAADMNGKNLGAQSGSSGYDAFTNQPEVLKDIVKGNDAVQYSSFTEGFLDVKAGRIDSLLIDEIYAGYYLANEPDGDDYTLIETGFDSENFAVGMRPADKILQEKINSTIEALVDDGTFAKLTKKWFNEELELPAQ